MSRTFRRYEPDQILLLPASLRDWLLEDHPAYFIPDVVGLTNNPPPPSGLAPVMASWVKYIP